ncbi:MAG: response regulator [Gammaproteobacteria bacterium]|nr:response regulator [Gammaproteobacteria bacterium]
MAVATSTFAQPEHVADDFLVQRWTNADGLPVNGTTDVAIGQQGYLWLATFDGLVRYDGHRFVTFDSSRYPGLPGNRLTELVEQPDGTLWILTEQFELASFDGRSFQTFGAEQGLPSDRVLKLHVDEDGTLWAGTEGGLARFDGTTFQGWAIDELSSPIQAIDDGVDSGIWVGTLGDGVVQLVDGEVRRRLGRSAGQQVDDVRSLAVAPSGTVWVGGVGGLARIDSDGARGISRFDASVVNAIALMPDGDVLAQDYERTYIRDDGTWRIAYPGPIGASVELLSIGPDGNTWRILQNELRRNGELIVRAPCPIKAIDFDDRGAVWMATDCDGLWRVRRREVDVVGPDQGLAEGPVYGMVEQGDGRLLATTADGAVSVVADGQRVGRYSSDDWGHRVGTLMIDRSGRIWIGLGRVCVLADGQCHEPPGLPGALSNDLIRVLFEAADGSVWVGAKSGVWRLREGDWQRMNERLDLPARSEIQSMLEARPGVLWFATRSEGLRRFGPGGSVTIFGEGDGLSSGSVRDLHRGAEGYLWVATEDLGLCRSTTAEYGSEPSFDCVDSDNGLYSNSLHRILPDGHGRFWFNSNSGVFRVERSALGAAFDEADGRIYPRVYTERDGLPDREGNGGVQNAGLRLSDGRLAFPGQGGISIFDPDDVRSAPSPPRVVMEELDLPGGDRIAARELVTLPRGERIFTVRFTGLSQGLTDAMYFRYRLNPGDERWIEIGRDRTLSFDRLEPGDHELEVLAVDATSGAAGPIASMQIRVPPYLYERTAFQLLLVFVVLAAAVLWVLRQQRLAARRQQALSEEVDRQTAEARANQHMTEQALEEVDRQRAEIERMADTRSRFFANVSHELRTPLTLLVGPLQDQVDSEPPPALSQAMLRNARRLERLVEQILDLERIDADRFPLDIESEDLVELVGRTVNAFRSQAERQGLLLEMNFCCDQAAVEVDGERVARIVGNLLSNALKFTPRGGTIRVDLAAARVPSSENADASGFSLSVSDSGPGIPAEWRQRIFDRFAQMDRKENQPGRGSGLGLALSREIARMHCGELRIESGDLGGCRFVLELPAGGTPATGTRSDRRVSSAATVEVEAARLADAADTSEEISSAHPGSRTERRHVMVVEDHADLRRYIQRSLADDYRTTGFEHGEAALEAAREDPPDAIVSDIVMPRMGGHELARALRAESPLAGIPLIFLTAQASSDDQVTGLEQGAIQYLSKPFRSEVLRAHVAAALRLCRRLLDRRAEQPPAADPDDDSLAARVRAWVEACAHEGNLSVVRAAEAMHMSRSNLRRRLMAETGQSPGDFVRSVRLDLARRLLRSGEGNVSEVAYAVGFVSLSGFSRAYREHFAESPSADSA